MIDRQKTKAARSDERGAALIVAIAIMTILLAVALTFYAISRTEMQNTDNVRNQTQNELHVEGVLAMVESELNRNFLKYPAATSLDTAPFTIYDGRWIVGKEWALRNDPVHGQIPLQGIDTDGNLLPDTPGVPLIDLRAMTDVRLTNPDGTFYFEQLFNGPRTRDWLTIPRFEGTNPYMYDPTAVDQGTGLAAATFNLARPDRPRFVTPAFYGPSDTRSQLVAAGLDTRLQGEIERYPLEWIDTWTDVDNDGDKLKDAIWIPIPQERLASGGEVINDLTGRRMFADGIDNDLDDNNLSPLDNLVDENQDDNLDYDNDTVPGGNDPDEQVETASFVYYGGNDGLDNDGDGVVDQGDVDEQPIPPFYGMFLAASLPGLVIPIDLNADGKVPDLVPDDANGGLMTPLTVTLPNEISVQVPTMPEDLDNPANTTVTIQLDRNRVDALDNDYDMRIDNYKVYAYVGPNTLTNPVNPPFQLRGFENTGEVYPPGTVPAALVGQPVIRAVENISATNANEDLFITAKLKSYELIHPSAFFGPLVVYPASSTFYSDVPGSGTYNFAANLPDILRITHSGEPVCDLAGRAAITIRDEASKVNVNVAGGHTYDPLADDVLRSLGDGATTAEIETRNLPDIGLIRSRDIWTYRTGGPEGAIVPGYESDTRLPGYGRVDDNASALVSAFNGKDDDGDGLIDEGLYLPPLSAMAERYLAGAPLAGDDPVATDVELTVTRYREYFNQLGAFEGVDEPAELQRFAALPNLVAEGNNPYKISLGAIDGLDNDNDGATNERGELGDLQMQDTLQLGDVSDIGTAVRRERILPLTTTFSTDRNTNFVSGREGIRAVNKLDYNLATPVQIAGNLILSNPFESVTARLDQFPNDVTRAYAEGLRQGDVHIRASGGLMWADVGGTPTPTALYFAADPVLQAMQAAVDIVDNRDSDHLRSMLTTEKTKVAHAPLGGYDYFPVRLALRERIADGDLLPLGELQDHLRDQMAISRKLEIRDDWWTFEAGITGLNGNPEVREISYTASGNEAIKINEIMVRAVRRVEAEAIPDSGLVGAVDPMSSVTPVNYNLFDPTPEADKIPLAPEVAGTNVLPDFTVLRETLVDSNWVLNGNAYLGDGTRLTTTGVDIEENTEFMEDAIQFLVFPTDPDDFYPDGLPSGRYYLTVKASLFNTTTLTEVALQGGQLEYSIKYVDYSVPDTTILQDVTAATPNAFANHFPQRWTSIPALHVATGIGEPLGWAFVNGTPAAAGLFEGQFGNYFLDGGLDHGGPLTGLPQGTFTVSVPEYTATDANGDSLPDRALCIAFRLNSGVLPNMALRIDSLDFSQEPDHEWVEVVNSSSEEVNIGDWNLEVGIPDKPSIPRDAFKSRWKVPPNTTVAPGGMVLLSFNKYDHYRAVTGTSPQNPVADRVADNGMGLAAGGFLPHTQNLTDTQVTVPDIKDLSSFPAATPAGLLDQTGSVFRRFMNPDNNFWDYVDRDGDGRSSIYAPANDTDNAGLEGRVRSTRELGSGLTATIENLPWDRIVQLECLQYASVNPTQAVSAAVTFDTIQSVDDVARMVLKGGVFPNYPEQDGFDNDGDGGYVDFTDVNGDLITELAYFPGALDRDMVDNDLDGIVDERGTSLFGDGIDSPLDYYGLLDTDLGDGVNQFLSEGVDEGRLVGAGQFLPGTIGTLMFNSRALGTYPADYPTDDPFNYFSFNSTTIHPYLAITPNGGTGIDALLAGPLALIRTFDVTNAPYIGSDIDPTDWKAFTERRWYPGDNVVVTLYEKVVSEDTVVDRVTYREQDITNRTVDDLVPWPYGTGTELNPAYPSFWRPNHMGLDFYRSIERKHPFYNGDRFGTTNRWEATDGNYDDWADSLSFYEAELGSDDTGNPVRFAADRVVDGRTRFPATTSTVAQERSLRLFGHAIWGTPLRMNTAARKSENPLDLEAVGTLPVTADRRQFPNPLDYFRTHEDGIFDGLDVPGNGIRTPVDFPSTFNTKSLPNQGWNHSRAVVANRAYQTPGDLMRVSHQVYLHDAFNTSGGSQYLRDMTLLNYGLQGDSGINDGLSYNQDIGLRSATLGQDTVDGKYSTNILSAAIASMALESVVLTVGQSEFRPILPSAADVSGDPSLLQWVPNAGGGSNPDDLLAPAAWTPVFLFGLPRDEPPLSPNAAPDHFPNYPTYVNGGYANVLFDRHYIFNANYFSDPLNYGGVDVYSNVFEDRWPMEKRTAMYVTENRGGVPAEALFTWDGADGLENGEYVLYIGTFMPELRQRIEDAAESSIGVVTSPAPIDMVAKNTPRLLSATPDPVTGFTSTLVFEDGNTVPVSPVTRSILVRDPTNPRKVNRDYDPVYAIDVITDPSEARGQAPASGGPGKPGGLIDPADWNPTVRYTAGPDGYIFYGNNADGGWKPQIVRVTDNFLAIRVRNVGDPGQVAAITHVVLAPRKRTSGRVNVNTAQSRVVSIGTTQEYYSPLLGLPGVVDVARTVQPSLPNSNTLAGRIPSIGSIALPVNGAPPATNTLTGLTPWTSPSEPPNFPAQFFLADEPAVPERNRYNELAFTDFDLLVPNLGFTEPVAHQIGSFRMNATLMGGRTEHVDGRYYTSVGALVSDASAFDYHYATSRADIPNLDVITPGVEDAAIYPLSNEADPAKRFDEVQARFSRLGNLVTTRSDVFEIIMTVEAGYGVDANRDGFLNYRDPREFVTTAATKATAVYERRTPSDTSDGSE